MPMRGFRIVKRTWEGLLDESGLALTTVVAMSAILFLLVTTLLTVVVFQASQVSKEITRNKAMHVADAGINAYMYELRRNPDFYLSTPTLSGTLENGDAWSVEASDTAGTMPLTLRSMGTLASSGATRTIVATVRYPGLAEPKYTYLAFGNNTIEPGTTIHGNVIVQKPSASTAAILKLYGHVTGFARCYGNSPGPSGRIDTVMGSYTGHADGGLQPFYQPTQDPPLDVDSQFAATKADLLARAQAAGTYFPRPNQPGVGAPGYWIELRGDYAVVWAGRGALVGGNAGDPPGTNFPNKRSIAPDGTFLPAGQEYHWDLASHPVFYFFSDVYVSGTYSASVTICGVGERVWLYHNLTPSPLNGTATLGIVSDRDVGVPWYASTPTNLTVYAAIFAKARAIFKGDPLGAVGDKVSFTFYGSMTSGGAIAGSNSLQQYGSTPYQFLHGYAQMDIWFDNRLLANPPPGFPLLTVGSTSRSIITVDSWVER